VPSLQDEFDRAIREQIGQLVVERLVSKLAAAGVTVTARQRRKLARAVESNDVSSVRLWSWPPWRTRQLSIEISAEEFAEIQRDVDALLGGLGEIVQEVVRRTEPAIHAHLVKRYPKELAREERDMRRFRGRLTKRWAEPLSQLRMIIALASHIAMESVPKSATETEDRAVLPFVLRQLHARGVRVAKEIVALLEAGFADGANARWRSMHEIAVVALFIQQHGEPCARRYVAHEVVENFKAARRYQEVYGRLGYEPIAHEELEAMRRASDAAVATHGAEFISDYGWAAAFLGNARPTFASLESRVSLEHLRPFYRMAGHAVHANSKGILFTLGGAVRDVYLLGPSNNGLADPGQSAGLTLVLLTTAIMGLNPTIDSIVCTKVLSALADTAAQRWVDTQNKLDADEARARAEDDRDE
jgi:hypothetical protein